MRFNTSCLSNSEGGVLLFFDLQILIHQGLDLEALHSVEFQGQELLYLNAIVLDLLHQLDFDRLGEHAHLFDVIILHGSDRASLLVGSVKLDFLVAHTQQHWALFGEGRALLVLCAFGLSR